MREADIQEIVYKVIKQLYERRQFHHIQMRYIILGAHLDILESIDESKVILEEGKKVEFYPTDKLILNGLNLSNLSKIALGIADNYETRQIQLALKNGLEIFCITDSLEKIRGNPNYETLFVKYERVLKSFGVKFLSEERFAQEIHNSRTRSKVLTFSDVEELAYGDTLVVDPNTILTATVKDRLNELKVNVIYKEGR